ncbi:VRR-NUC domain-containing protein, partial [Pelistega indica]
RYAYWFMPATHGYGRSGVPDFVVCKDGHFFGIECKGTPKNKTTILQRLELDKILKAGGGIAVVDRSNIDVFKEWLQDVDIYRTKDFRRDQDKMEI